MADKSAELEILEKELDDALNELDAAHDMIEEAKQRICKSCGYYRHCKNTCKWEWIGAQGRIPYDDYREGI